LSCPLSREPLSAGQAAQVAPLLKAQADPVRLRLTSLIASHPGGEAASAISTTRST
jgi:ArsR family transcriptional regulator